MADQSQHLECSEKPPASASDSQLQYPQLLIEASFQSLLSHSQSSEPRTVYMPRSEVSLSESWSSLSEHDLSHDDDLQSEATDTGSLIDASNTGDIHSVNDLGQLSDGEPEDEDNRAEEDRAVNTSGSRGLIDSAISESFLNTSGQNSIRLDDSTVIVDSSGMTSLQASRSFTPAEMRFRAGHNSQPDTSEIFEEIIEIAMSPDNLKIMQRPYQILYHGSKYCSPEMKHEILGKIGAALISVDDQQKLEDRAESPCYHIIPSEFGPGSRPSTTDLIPIPTQMHITECTVLNENSLKLPDSNICFQLSTGGKIVSRRAKLFEVSTQQEWTKPDLVVTVISHNDAEDDRSQAEDIARFAQRHRIASIFLRQEYNWDGDDFMIGASPHMLLRQIRSSPQHIDRLPLEHLTLLDTDTFLSLDAEQLNQHLKYLTDSANIGLYHKSNFPKYLNTQSGSTCRKLLEFLPAGLSNRILGADTNANHKTQWIIDVSPSSSPHSQQVEKGQEKVIKVQNMKDYRSMLSPLYNTALLISVSLLTMFMFYTLQAVFVYLTSTSVPRISVGNSAETYRCLPSTSKISVSTVTAEFIQISALSGPFQPSIGQVRSSVSAGTRKAKVDAKLQASEELIKAPQEQASQVCRKVVSVQISRNLKMSKDFFSTDTQHIHVKREDREVDAMIQRRSEFTIAILIKRKDMYGKFTVSLGTGEQKTCAIIDMENLWEESLTLWANSMPDTYKKHKKLERLANKWTQLLEVRAPESGLAGNALELKYTAAQGLGAVVEVVEKATVKHAKACQRLGEQGLMHMLGLPDQRLALPVERARRVSEDAIQNAREHVDEAVKHSKDRANKIVEQAKEEVSRAAHKIQSSIQSISMYPKAMSKRLAEAQLQAQNLVGKSGMGRRNGRKLA